MLKLIFAIVAALQSLMLSVSTGIDSIISKLNLALDAKISTRQASWGATTAHRDRIDTTISSRQPDVGLTATHALRIDTNISTRADQTTVDAIKAKTDKIFSSSSSTSSIAGSVPVYSNQYIPATVFSTSASSVELVGIFQTAGGVPNNAISAGQLIIYEDGISIDAIVVQSVLGVIYFNVSGKKLRPNSHITIAVNQNYYGNATMSFKVAYRLI